MKPIIAIRVRKTQFASLSALTRIVISDMTGNANFPTPSPSLAALTTLCDNLDTGILNWGPVHARGSHADYVALQVAANACYNGLVSEAGYVTSAAAGDGTIILSSGFELKRAGSPQGPLGPVQNLHQIFNQTIDIHTPKVLWKKPSALLSPQNVKLYQVFRNTTNDFFTSTKVGQSTKRSFIDTTVIVGTKYYYWIVAYNAAGSGTPSMALLVSVPL